jgi:hypothetical protein
MMTSCDVIHVMTWMSISRRKHTQYDVKTNEFWKKIEKKDFEFFFEKYYL